MTGASSFRTAGIAVRVFSVVLVCAHGVAVAQEQEESGSVVRSTFTSSVEQREPVDSIMSLSCDQGQIFYFTELRNLEGQVVTHRWTYEGDLMADITINVGGPRWRAWSSKRLIPEWLGEWSVQVLDDSGQVLAQDSFVCMPSAEGQLYDADAVEVPAGDEELSPAGQGME